jgi:hypothetical protein
MFCLNLSCKSFFKINIDVGIGIKCVKSLITKVLNRLAMDAPKFVELLGVDWKY